MSPELKKDGEITFTASERVGMLITGISGKLNPDSVGCIKFLEQLGFSPRTIQVVFSGIDISEARTANGKTYRIKGTHA